MILDLNKATLQLRTARKTGKPSSFGFSREAIYSLSNKMAAGGHPSGKSHETSLNCEPQGQEQEPWVRAEIDPGNLSQLEAKAYSWLKEYIYIKENLENLTVRFFLILGF